MTELSPAQAKRFIIARQGLHKKNVFGSGDAALLDCVERLGYVQIDTISVIHRAHHHTLWTRLPTFRQPHLDTLQSERKVFEYWAHAAAYLPMRDYRFSLPYMNAIAGGQKHWRTPDKKLMKSVLDRIRSDGAARARDFESSGQRSQSAWGGKKPAKHALEQLFIEGRLMISHRDGFEKVFDLPERILPSDIDTKEPTTEEFCRHLILRTLQAQGLATEAEMSYLRKGIKAALRNQIQQMLADQEIVRVHVRDNPNDYFAIPELVEQAYSTRVTKKVHLLSPFDNLVIQRKRMMQLFDFDYQIECYLPADRRKHGYFCLPILFGDELVGRLDPKADRKDRRLIVRNLVIEKDVQPQEAFINELVRKILAMARFNDCDSVSIERCNVKPIGSALKRLIA